MLTPKNDNIKVKIKNTKNTIINPTIAATMVPRADSIPALSPPEVIHLTAPKSKKNRATITAITKIKPIAADITLDIVNEQIEVNGPVGGHDINCADADGTRDR